MKDDQCSWVKHLIHSCTIVLVLNSYALLIDLILRRLECIADFGVELHLQLVIDIVQVDLLILLNELLLLLMTDLVHLLLVELLKYPAVSFVLTLLIIEVTGVTV